MRVKFSKNLRQFDANQAKLCINEPGLIGLKLFISAFNTAIEVHCFKDSASEFHIKAPQKIKLNNL